LRVEPVADALGSASVIILATPSVRDDAGIRALAASLGDVSGKVVIDATNPLGSFGESLNGWGGDGTSGGEVLASALPGARVYKRPQTRSASSTCGPPWGRT
jgi:predicted dinucleotide-binding enzyme